jgi:DNA-binding Lrp family transcriptional regulator
MSKKEQICPELDDISKNILYLLSLDSRMSVSQMSKSIGVSRKKVDVRVNRLLREKIITPIMISNYQCKIGVFLRLSSFEKDIIERLKEIENIEEVISSLGYYDFYLVLSSNNDYKIDKVIKKINKIAKGNILNMDILNDLKERRLYYKEFKNTETERQIPIDFENNFSKLNKDQILLLKILKKDPLKDYRGLIISTGWSFKKIKNLLGGLVRERFIKFSIDIDFKKIGLEYNEVLVRINKAIRERFEERLVNNPNIFRIKQGVGRWDYILSFYSADIEQFINLTQDFRIENKEFLLDFNTLILKNT